MILRTRTVFETLSDNIRTHFRATASNGELLARFKKTYFSTSSIFQCEKKGDKTSGEKKSGKKKSGDKKDDKPKDLCEKIKAKPCGESERKTEKECPPPVPEACKKPPKPVCEKPKAIVKPKRLKEFAVYRYIPGKSPFTATYTVDLNDCGPMILDALLYIKNKIDPTISFRRSCREGVCGSCAMNVDGVNGLACITKIKGSGKSKIYPLPHSYIIRDLITNMNMFYEQYNHIKPWLIKECEVFDTQLLQSVKDRDKLDGLTECILCGCCSFSCPLYWWNGDSQDKFLGPAALLASYRWITDSRDDAKSQRLNQLTGYYSAFRCHSIFNCTMCCPKHLNPGKAIVQLKQMLAGVKSLPKPDMTERIKKPPVEGPTGIK